MTVTRLPFLLKVVVAAAVLTLLVVGAAEIRRNWPKEVLPEPPKPEATVSTKWGLYQDTLFRIRDLIAFHTSGEPEAVLADMKLTDLGVDMLTRVDVAESLESADHIELSNQELAGLETVDDLVRLVVKKKQQFAEPKAP